MSPSRPSPLHALAGLAADLGPALVPDGHLPLLTAICDAARTSLGAAACSLATVGDDDATLTYVAAAGEGADQIVGLELPLTRGIAGWSASTGQALELDRVADDPRFAADVAARTGYVPARMMLVPVGDDEIAGVLSVLDRDESIPEALAVAGRFARLAAQALPMGTAVRDMGRLLFAAAADAVAEAGDADRADLAAALRRAASRSSGRDADVAALAARLAEVRRLGPAESAAIGRMVDEFLAYARARRRR